MAAAFNSDVAFNSDLGAVNIEINPFALVPPHMDDYDHYTKGMAIPVVEFSREGYKIRNVFG